MSFDYDIYNVYSEIEELSNAISKSHNIDDLKKLYSYVKDKSDLFYIEGNIINSYNIVKKNIRKSEDVFDDLYLTDVSFYLDKINVNKDSNEYELLDFIVNETRKFLLNCKHLDVKYDSHYKVDFTNWCEKASLNVKYLCKFLKIDCNVVEVQPGFSISSLLFNGCGFHFFNVVRFNDRFFLVDLTFDQFFKVKDCLLDRIGIMNYPTPKLGAFIDSGNVPSFIKEILFKGYVEINDDVFKSYMDLFTLSFRNGLYYEKTSDYSYKSKYTINDYINFLDGIDSQVKHEGKEVLGFQKRPIRR